MKPSPVFYITSFSLACALTIAVIPSQADVSNNDYLLIAKDQTRDRDRDRLRDKSCLDAIDAARAAMDRDRIREAKKQMDKAREECDSDQDRDRDRDRDQDKDQDRDRDQDRTHQ